VPGKISVTKLEGKVLGGNLLATLALERAPGGANVAGDVRLTGAHLQASAAGGADEAKDATAALALEFSGRAATPGGLVAVATGKGEITLPDMSMRVPTPLAVVTTSEAVLTGEAGGSGEALTESLRAHIASSDVKVGPRTIAIEIADGAARLAPFALPSTAGATKVETTVDLASLMVDSTWLLEPKAPDVVQPDHPRKGALPSVSVVYVGPLQDAWSLQPRITAEPLERELAIRKMELDAEQLERLHRLDAERARQEDERRQAIEAEQADRDPAPPAAPPDVDGTALSPQQGAVDPEGLPLPPQGTIVPAVPGLEADVTPLPTTDATAADPASGTPAAVAAEPAAPAPSTYRRRAVRRQVPAGEQVLRALQNNAQ
jgi:hypothetical protein